ncbi:MAG TPA: tryptophan--tRNA ligase [Thermomicrobiales bacterium]|nr:tryptophan--tRNA ligase [Thermomicrobiales bacterium]
MSPVLASSVSPSSRNDSAAADPVRPRLLTGDRPTGPLHLGHLVGTLRNRVRLQDAYDCTFIVADLHMLTTRNAPEQIAEIDANARTLVLDALGAGLDPTRVTFYLQSLVPEVLELAGLFQSLVSVNRLERIPSLKEMARDSGQEMSFALLGYPVLQAADILAVRAEAVPVGKDNYAYVEVTREIARRFNARYGEVFPEPETVEGDVPTLVGTDGQRKMSKSLGNAIALSDPAPVVRKKVMGMFTDPNRLTATTPGRVEGNPVFAYLDAFGADIATIEALKDRYRAGRVGDVEVKAYLVEVLESVLQPMRERRETFAAPGVVETLIEEGSERVRTETRETLRLVRTAMGFAGVHTRLHRRARKAGGGLPGA